MIGNYLLLRTIYGIHARSVFPLAFPVTKLRRRIRDECRTLASFEARDEEEQGKG